jgi:hypothetical protein
MPEKKKRKPKQHLGFLKNVLIISGRDSVILWIQAKEVNPMTSVWLKEVLQAHLPEEEFQRIQPYLYTECWATPSSCFREQPSKEFCPPLRHQLQIDLKV